MIGVISDMSEPKRPTRSERKRELYERTFVLVTEEGKPVQCTLGPGLPLDQAVEQLVRDGYTGPRRPYETRDVAIWHKGQLVAVCRNRQGQDVITMFD